jgi:predicted MPP superfamily phosphohydrolase
MTENGTVRLLHISDLHFGSPFLPAVADALLQKLRQISADAVIVSGDFTQRARTREFEAAARFLKLLPDVPRLVIPGNHDVPLYRVIERLFRPLDGYRRHISDELNPVLQLNGAVIVGLDSTSPYRNISVGTAGCCQDCCDASRSGTGTRAWSERCHAQSRARS